MKERECERLSLIAYTMGAIFLAAFLFSKNMLFLAVVAAGAVIAIAVFLAKTRYPAVLSRVVLASACWTAIAILLTTGFEGYQVIVPVLLLMVAAAAADAAQNAYVHLHTNSKWRRRHFFVFAVPFAGLVTGLADLLLRRSARATR